MSPDRPLFLVGFMGSGKSTAGRLVAGRLDVPFVDTDALVEAREGRSIARIFAESGEGAFRELEWRALESLADAASCVVATGGGLFVGAVQRRFIGSVGRSMWLDLPLDEARRRVEAGDSRPLWLPGDPVGLRALFERRRAVYALADCRIDARGSPDEVAERILRRQAD